MRKSLLLALVLLLLGPGPVWSQEGASLGEVEAFLAQGRIMEARGTLETWWTTWFSSASRTDRQRGIWLRGKLTVDPALAELDFRRLALEFPGGPYSDDALFRLGLSADLRGDLREAQASFEKLVEEYPASPRVSEARRWIRLHSRQVIALAEERAPPPTQPVEEAESPEAGGSFAVQVGAFRSLDRARSLFSQLTEAGYEPRLVRTHGNELARVRVGRFPTRESADQLARELEDLGFDVTLATDAEAEEQVGNRA